MSLLMRLRWLWLIAVLLPLGVHAQEATQAVAAPIAAHYQWNLVVGGFNSPVLVTNAGDARLFVVEQDGFIFVVTNGTYDGNDPFLDVSDLLSNDVFQAGYTERGLLGLAFDPGFKSSGIFYIAQTDKTGSNVLLVRYHVKPGDPNHADPASRSVILTIPHPQYDHNAGMLAFGPDGYLYMGVGDGGSQGDNPGAPSQDLTSLLGKILRLDVKNTDTYTIPADNPFAHDASARPEIWAYGLRNPWRFSFDDKTGDLYIGDVGQADYEEIDFQPAGDPGGENYGWNDYEGMHSYLGRAAPANMILPVAEYPHLVGCAVMGGVVYRGEALPELQGVYFFGDYCSGRTWSLRRGSVGQWLVQPFTPTALTISAFGEDAQGELYLVDFKGGIYRLVRAS